MTRNQIDWEHDYLLSPNDYPINDNEAHSTYDQFIQLRDTLLPKVMSGEIDLEKIKI